MTSNSTSGNDRYQYESEGQRRIDDRHADRARDLAQAGIFDEARREAGKVEHYQRSMDLLDKLSRDRRHRARTDGGTQESGSDRREAYRVECPHCGVPEGATCEETSPFGRTGTYRSPHPERRELAREELK